jgi:hypothetical protein
MTEPATFRPAGTLDSATALAPYSGPWDRRHAAHLLRRAGFGGSPADVERIAALSPQAAVEGLVHFPDTRALAAGPDLEVPPIPPRGLYRGFAEGMAADPEVADQRKAFQMQRNASRRRRGGSNV